jgi:hypothetical protein
LGIAATVTASIASTASCDRDDSQSLHPPLGVFTSTEVPLPEVAKVLDAHWLGQQVADHLKERAADAFRKGNRVTVMWTLKDGFLHFEFKIDTPFAQFCEELIKKLESLPIGDNVSECMTLQIPLK